MVPNGFAFFSTAVASFPFFLLGYEVAVLYGQNKIQESFEETIDGFEDSIRGFVFFSALLAGFLMSTIGRQKMFFVGALAYTVGVAVLVIGYTFKCFKAGRGLMGVGLGFGLAIGPVYIAEISPARHRGFLESIPQLFLCLGAMMGYVMEYAFSKVASTLGWRFMMAIPGVASFIFTVLAAFRMPESPCFLVINGRVRTARQLFEDKLRTPAAEVEARMRQLKNAAGISQETERDTVLDETSPGGIPGMWGQLSRRETWGIIMVAAVQQALQRVSGEYILLSYIRLTLAQNKQDSREMYLAAIQMLLGSKLLGSLLASFLLDRCFGHGRVSLMVVSTSTTMVAMAGLGGAAIASQHGRITRGTAFRCYVAGSLGLEAGTGLGLGPVPWLYGPEALMLPARAIGVTLAVAAGLGVDWLLDLKVIPISHESITAAGTPLLVFSSFMFVGALSCLFMKDRSQQVLLDAVVDPPDSSSTAS
ncbi:unnamed protein product [Linum trigynum]|uniref:Major facilitator superfamily (MFS) profile domain-containing protein n=1 Tax=Linum trigynum TaxID=586398 RepID=A0AAV2GGI5_9ROSI